MSYDFISDSLVKICIGLVFFGIGMCVIGSAYNHELQQRGLKEYDRATGRLIWTEKAGGEKGGDK